MPVKCLSLDKEPAQAYLVSGSGRRGIFEASPLVGVHVGSQETELVTLESRATGERKARLGVEGEAEAWVGNTWGTILREDCCSIG